MCYFLCCERFRVEVSDSFHIFHFSSCETTDAWGKAWFKHNLNHIFGSLKSQKWCLCESKWTNSECNLPCFRCCYDCIHPLFWYLHVTSFRMNFELVVRSVLIPALTGNSVSSSPQIKGTLCVYFSPACSIHVLRHQLVYQWCWWRKRRTVKNASDHSRKVWLQWLQQIRAFRNVSYEKSILDTEMCHSNITLICVSPQPRSSGSVSDGGPRLWTSVCQRQRFLHLQMFWRIYVGWRWKELQKYDLFDTDPLPLEFQ